ncbi:MAG: hypothetical protein NVSMB51_17910 [Solirubrobacteraceae bacterium]
MPNVERMDDWRGQDVLDSTGEKLGKLDELFYASGAEEPALVAVKSGLLGRRVRIVPLRGATFSRDHVSVPFTREQVESADEELPEGMLEAQGAVRLSSLYGVEVAAGRYETASGREELRRAAIDAREHADELEVRAQERQGDIERARAEAEQAAQRAAQLEREGQGAREAAEQARRVASEAERRRP